MRSPEPKKLLKVAMSLEPMNGKTEAPETERPRGSAERDERIAPDLDPVPPARIWIVGHRVYVMGKPR